MHTRAVNLYVLFKLFGKMLRIKIPNKLIEIIGQNIYLFKFLAHVKLKLQGPN